MKIIFHGHSCFSLKGKAGTVVCDPFGASLQIPLKKLTADMVTISHQHDDHNAVDKVGPTAKRERPFIVDSPGEYEVAGVSVFGFPSFHDATQGSERGRNTMFLIQIDEVSVLHLGDLGHPLNESILEQLGRVDVLLCPVGGTYTINAKEAVAIIKDIAPSIVVPMHYAGDFPEKSLNSTLAPLTEFLNAFGTSPQPIEELGVTADALREETQLVDLSAAA
jgi:L-ascorbate metabolism protein UlaG (beta-lactamase superfamily)